MTDQERIPPYNIKRTSNEKKENINLGTISWSNTKFSEPES